MPITSQQYNGQSALFNAADFITNYGEKFMWSVSSSSLHIFHDVPVMLSTFGSPSCIIILNIPYLKNEKNFYKEYINGKDIYLNNVICPIIFFQNFIDSTIRKDEYGDVYIDNNLFDISDVILKAKEGVSQYFSSRLSKKFLLRNIDPIIFIKNKGATFFNEQCIVAEDLTFQLFLNCIFFKRKFYLLANKEWYEDKSETILNSDLTIVLDALSKDSKNGYLTKKKLDLITNNLDKSISKLSSSNNNRSSNYLQDKLIIISGRAGTGKTQSLITLMVNALNEKRNVRFLTYNHLLVKDIGAQTYQYIKNSSKVGKEIGSPEVLTIHAFFYRISKNIGILSILTLERIKNIISANEIALKEIFPVLSQIILSYNTLDARKDAVLNPNNKFTTTQKNVSIEYLNSNAASFEDFIKGMQASLIAELGSEVFLLDYYNVLKVTLQTLRDPKSIFDKYEVHNLFDLLFVTLDYDKGYYKDDPEIKQGKISLNAFHSRVRNIIAGHKKVNANIFIDEAQDFHDLEKEILYEIFKPENIVIASGGSSQLIRNSKICDWTIHNGNILDYFNYKTGSKTYRAKKNIVSLCNFLAERFKLPFSADGTTYSKKKKVEEENHQLSIFDTLLTKTTAKEKQTPDTNDFLTSDHSIEDVGKVILDFRNPLLNTEVENVFQELFQNGVNQRCVPLENMLVLTHNKGGDLKRKLKVDADDIVISQSEKIGTEWSYLNELSKVTPYWDGRFEEKRKHSAPFYSEVRVIKYDSCRGLEAWNVACFDIDLFFKKKLQEEEAEKFMIESTLNFTTKERKEMFATTWVLMALTRAIDTLYIRVSEEEFFETTDFKKALLEYAEKFPSKVMLY